MHWTTESKVPFKVWSFKNFAWFILHMIRVRLIIFALVQNVYSRPYILYILLMLGHSQFHYFHYGSLFYERFCLIAWEFYNPDSISISSPSGHSSFVYFLIDPVFLIFDWPCNFNFELIKKYIFNFIVWMWEDGCDLEVGRYWVISEST